MTNRISDPTNGAFGMREAEWPQPTPDELDEFICMLESITARRPNCNGWFGGLINMISGRRRDG